MYAEMEILFPYYSSFSQETQQLKDFCSFHGSTATSNIAQTSTVAEYNLGAEGDLFKAPEPIIEESPVELDPVTATISMISIGENMMSSQTMEVPDIESEHLLSDVFYECRKDLLAKSAIEERSQTTEFDVTGMMKSEQDTDTVTEIDNNSTMMSSQDQVCLPKCVSSECLSSMETITGTLMNPSFLDFPNMDLGDAFGMRRAFSESDIQTLSNANMGVVRFPFERPPVITIGSYTLEERQQKLSRYRKKKDKRNFGRKIKYACRKVLADSQPRVRGRFAKN